MAYEATLHNASGVVRDLWQWDSGIQVKIGNHGLSSAPAVHFCNRNSKEALVVASEIKDGYIVAEIPNILLEKDLPIIMYLYISSSDTSAYTIHSTRFFVKARPKPSDYVYIENVKYASILRLEKTLQKTIALADTTISKIADMEVSAESGDTATAEVDTTGEAIVLRFTLPKGDPGEKGADAQIVQVRNLGVERAYPRMIQREGSLYLFTDNAFVMSVDGGASFSEETVVCSKTNADDLALCAEDGVTSLDTVANATPIVLADGRIAVYYRANNTAVGYASIRVRYLYKDGSVSAPQNIVKKTGLPTGGLWEPFPIYINDTLYLYYCDSGNADESQSVEFVRLTADGLPDANPATAIGGYTDGGKVRRPGMPSIAVSEGKYYMVVEDNDGEHLAGTGKTVGVELWESEDGITAWTYRGVMFPEHTAEHSGAPYILAREDGRIVIGFQSDLEEIADLCDELKHHDRRFFAYESAEITGDPFGRTYAKKCTYRYAPNEAGYWGSLAEINGTLYCIFNHGLHKANGYDTLGVALVSDAIAPGAILNAAPHGYVPRSTENGVVYVRSGYKDTTFSFAADSAKGGTMVRRRSDGTIKCADPVNDNEAVTKKYADDGFVPNVAPDTSGVVYAVVGGKNIPIKWGQANPEGNTIVRRTASGCIICADPLSDRCAATKKYVDDLKKETLDYIDEAILGGAW